MNLVLISTHEAEIGLDLADSRTLHLRDTVGLSMGGAFHVGIENGFRGIAKIVELAPRLRFTVQWERTLQSRLPLSVIIGLPRPQTAKKVLHDLSNLGVSRLVFFEAMKGDPGYLSSSLWKNGEWLTHLRKGAEQGCSALIPEVARVGTLSEALDELEGSAWKVALDPYAAVGTPEIISTAKSGILIIGPERGFAEPERLILRHAGFSFAHLGDRILRVESAALIGSALMLAQMQAWEKHRPIGGTDIL